MTSQGSALTRFEMAVKTGNPNIVLAAAHELPKPMLLRDALRVVLVLATRAPERFSAAAARFGARLVSERGLSVTEAQLVFAALQTLAGDPHAVQSGRGRGSHGSTLHLDRLAWSLVDHVGHSAGRRCIGASVISIA